MQAAGDAALVIGEQLDLADQRVFRLQVAEYVGDSRRALDLAVGHIDALAEQELAQRSVVDRFPVRSVGGIGVVQAVTDEPFDVAHEPVEDEQDAALGRYMIDEVVEERLVDAFDEFTGVVVEVSGGPQTVPISDDGTVWLG